MAKAAAKKAPKKGFEETLWDTANKLRGSVESSEYKHIVLSLIFLKFISDKFETQRARIESEYGADFVDMVDFYTQDNVFYLPETSRWSYVLQHAKQNDIAVKIDSALHDIEKNNKQLAGALPDNYFSRLGLDGSKLAALIDTINNIDTIANECDMTEQDLVGRVYEYFLGKFAATEGKGGGEFYTPKCVVTLIAEMIEPYKGKIYDPCCGSGGMFVQSIKFVDSHKGNRKDISIYGQEYTSTTYKLAKMNLAIRGIAANFGDVAGDTFFKDQHPDLKAGFVLANGSMSSNTSGEGTIRKKIIENDLVDCMIALPGQLFYTTQIPVCLWFLTKNKKGNTEQGTKGREGETLFIDARNMGTMVSRTTKELTTADIAEITRTYHAFRGEADAGIYEDKAGFCKIATLEEIATNDYVLTPGRYVGAAELKDDGIPFEVKMQELSQTLYKQMAEAQQLDAVIRKNLAMLGYGENA